MSDDEVLKKARAIYLDRSDKLTAVSKYILDTDDSSERERRVISVLDGAFYRDTPDEEIAKYHAVFSAITDQEELFDELMQEFYDQANILYKNTTK